MLREFSAGGVVTNAHGQTVVIVPTRRAAGGHEVLALPKGHADGDETPEQAAIREVREETGLNTEVIERLGEVSYWYQRDGKRVFKVVRFFLLGYVNGSLEDHDDEVQEARWMDLGDAAQLLTHAGDREMVRLAQARSRRER